MQSTIVIFGRQGALGLAEIESLAGNENVTPVGRLAALYEGDIPFSRLGGATRAGEVITILDTNKWHDIEKYLMHTLPERETYVPEGKLTLGVSIFGVPINSKQLERTVLSIKKELRKSGRSVRIVPNKAAELSSPQVIHNHLTGTNGWEILIVAFGRKTIIARTTHIQDIESYTKRDQQRPMRDAKVGMLPPKLAQIIINLANPGSDSVILDPFCGTGVLLQEAKLMGYDVIGSDIEPRMTEYTTKNLQWLQDTFTVNTNHTIQTGDAASIVWQKSFQSVAAEIFLGKPLSTQPDSHMLRIVSAEVVAILEGFLKNLAKQSITGTRICLAIPAWRTKNGFYHLPLLDQLGVLGYNRLSFAHVNNNELMYYREDQVVARELLVLVRK